MSLLEQMESVNPSERIILTYDAWRKLMNDIEALDRVARAAKALVDRHSCRRAKELVDLEAALKEAEHLLD